MLSHIPQGLHQILELFGDPSDPDFERLNIVSFDLPYPLLYGDSPVVKTRCHRLAVDHFIQAFEGIRAAGLQREVLNYGGIYNRRAKRGTIVQPSTHSWGIAVDLEPWRYPLGSANRFSPEVVRIFRDAGFFYGGDFAGRKDPMHFQLAEGY